MSGKQIKLFLVDGTPGGLTTCRFLPYLSLFLIS